MEVLVTGGAGFIGSHLCERLLDRGYHLICLDNFNDLYSPKIKEGNIAKASQHPNFTLVKGDILDDSQLSEIFLKHKIQKIVHLAAMAGVRSSVLSPARYVDVDIKGTVNLLEKAKIFQIKGFTFASSSSVYGINEKVPFSEKDDTSLQISPYATAKKAAELYCQTYHLLYKIPVTILRIFTVYGPRQRPDMAIYKFTQLISKDEPIQTYGDGSSKRDYTYIDDAIQGILNALENTYQFEIFNLGNSKIISLEDLIELIGRTIGKIPKIERLPNQLGDVPITYADISKARNLLKYEPQTSIEEGIKKFTEWFKETNEE